MLNIADQYWNESTSFNMHFREELVEEVFRAMDLYAGLTSVADSMLKAYCAI
jgi:hypothetical protein